MRREKSAKLALLKVRLVARVAKIAADDEEIQELLGEVAGLGFTNVALELTPKIVFPSPAQLEQYGLVPIGEPVPDYEKLLRQMKVDPKRMN